MKNQIKIFLKKNNFQEKIIYYIKKFELTNVNAGMPMHTVTVNRADFTSHQEEKLFPLAVKGITVEPVTPNQTNYKYNPESSFPNIFWNLAPNLRTQLGGPDGFFFGDLSLSFNAETKFSPKFSLVTQANLGLISNLDGLKLSSDSILPHVRTAAYPLLAGLRRPAGRGNAAAAATQPAAARSTRPGKPVAARLHARRHGTGQGVTGAALIRFPRAPCHQRRL